MTRIRLLCATALAGGALAGLARAQTTAAPPAPAPAAPGEVSAVVVTGNHREQSIQSAPYDVSAVTGAKIDENQIRSSPELLRTIPGVAVIDRGPRNDGTASNIFMRGVNVDSTAVGDYPLPSVAPVSTYWGDTPVFANFALIDLNRVEVLRGPQGTFYGSGSLGGTVRYIFNQPQFDVFSGYVSASASHTAGSDSAGGAYQGVVNIPVAHNLAIRIDALYDDWPGSIDYANIYQTGPGGVPLAPQGIFSQAGAYRSQPDTDFAKIGMGRLAVRWDPVQTVDLTLTWAHQHDQIGGRQQITTGDNGYGVPYGPYENGGVILEPSARTIDLIALESVIDFGFATLTSSTSWYDHRGSSTTDNTGFYANDATFHDYYYNYPRPDVPAFRTYQDKAYVEEVRLVSKPGKTFDWVVGAYFNHDDYYQTQTDYVLGFKEWWDALYAGYPAAQAAVASDEQFAYHAYQRTTDVAGFGELTWHVTDRWQITGGLRHFHTAQDTDLYINFPAFTYVSEPDAPPTISQPSDKTLFRGNTAYRISDDAQVYFTVSQGYRRGGVNEVATIGRWAESPTWQTYAPDTLVNYELGAKGRFLGATYDATLFYEDWRHIQLNTFTETYGFYAVANGNTARSAGLELQIEGNPLPRLHYLVGYTLTDAQLTSNFYAPTGNLIAVNGAQLPGTPKDQVNVALDYTVPLPNTARLGFHINGYYQSTTQNAVGHPTYVAADQFEATLPRFTLWNLSAVYSIRKIDVTLFVKNIFNANGVTGEFTQAYTGTNPAASFYGNDAREFISLPRTVGGTATYHW
jgi:outer membrane receptor protein involved in Fe transport